VFHLAAMLAALVVLVLTKVVITKIGPLPDTDPFFQLESIALTLVFAATLVRHIGSVRYGTNVDTKEVGDHGGRDATVIFLSLAASMAIYWSCVYIQMNFHPGRKKSAHPPPAQEEAFKRPDTRESASAMPLCPLLASQDSLSAASPRVG
jgi:hypothetical protein